MIERVYIGVGSNLGDRLGHCSAAIRAIDRLDDTRVVDVSPWYETEPVGDPSQPRFLNGALALDTALAPRMLLNACLSIERERGRERRTPNAARTLDLDLLLYGNAVVNEADLVVPHPRLAQRGFVVIPLADIAPAVIHPVLRLSIGVLRRQLADPHTVTLFPPAGFVER